MFTNVFVRLAITQIISVIMKSGQVELLREFLTKIADRVESQIINNSSKVDDLLLLPIRYLRALIGLPDTQITSADLSGAIQIAFEVIERVDEEINFVFNIKCLLDDAIDFLENKILGTASELDDNLFLPILNFIRTVLDIPDDIGGDED